MPELWTPVDGVNRKLKSIYAPVDGVSRKLKSLWAGDAGGVARKIYQSGLRATLGNTYNLYATDQPVTPIHSITESVWTAGIHAYGYVSISTYEVGGQIDILVPDPIEISSVELNAVSVTTNMRTKHDIQYIITILDSSGSRLASNWILEGGDGAGPCLVSLSVPISATISTKFSIRLSAGWDGSGSPLVMGNDNAYWSIPSGSISLSTGDRIYY